MNTIISFLRISLITILLGVNLIVISFLFPNFLDKDSIYDVNMSVYNEYEIDKNKVEAAESSFKEIYSNSVGIAFSLRDLGMILIYIGLIVYGIKGIGISHLFELRRKQFFGYILLYNAVAFILDIVYYTVGQSRNEYPVWADSIGIPYMWSLVNSVALLFCMCIIASHYFLTKTEIKYGDFKFRNFYSIISFFFGVISFLGLIFFFGLSVYSVFNFETTAFLQNLGIAFFFFYLFIFYGSIRR